jgi:hypothetical protein
MKMVGGIEDGFRRRRYATPIRFRGQQIAPGVISVNVRTVKVMNMLASGRIRGVPAIVQSISSAHNNLLSFVTISLFQLHSLLIVPGRTISAGPFSNYITFLP